jgi:hypothetical protein
VRQTRLSPGQNPFRTVFISPFSPRGQATHLGRFTREASAVLQPDGVVVGTLVWTAANGDQLFANLEAGFVSPTTAVGTYTFVGGTGRFENASGEADFETVTSDGIHFLLTFEGTIGF